MFTIRKWWLLLVAALVPMSAHADGMLSNKFLASGAGTPINNIGTAITEHKLTWNVSGTASVCTVALDSSADGVTWTAGGVIAGQTCTSNGSTTVTAATVNYVRINMTALTVTAGSSVTVTWNGYVNAPGGGGTIASCTTTGGVAFENGTANTLTCGPSLTFDGTTFTDSASTTNTTTSHFGDPNSSFTSPNNLWGIFPGRNEINSTNAGDNLYTLSVVGQNGAFGAIGAFNYANATPPNLMLGMETGAAYDGITTSNPLIGRFDLSHALNGANITGNGQEAGFVASSRLEPHVDASTSTGAAGANSHADFLYGVHANPVVGDGGTDGSTVTNAEAFQADLNASGSSVVVTNFMGYEVLNPGLLSGATITTAYGYHAVHLTTAGTNWGFYSDAANNDHFGNLQATSLQAATYATATECKANGTAASPSVASCSAAASGMFSCATNASTATCQVNTTAVTANSVILITQDQADGGAGQLNVTCNTTNVLSTTKPILVSKSAGSNFVINLGTVASNPACFEYHIIN